MIGQKLITINYKSFSDSFEITVLDNAHIVELRINKLPDSPIKESEQAMFDMMKMLKE